MSSDAVQPSYILIRRLADVDIEWLPLEGPERVGVAPGADYALVDRADYEAPETLVARRQGDDLIVEVQGTEVLVLDGFFAARDVAFYPTTDIAGAAGPFTRTPLTPDAPVLPGSTEQVVWSAEAEKPAETAAAGDGGGGSPLLWGGLAAGGLGLAALAGGGGGGGGGGNGGGNPQPALQITSGATAPEIAENSGAGQMVYTATANATGTVTFSLEDGADAAVFSIDPDSGVVTLTENPDFETQSSYSFTVVATDGSGERATQTVSLSIEDQDDSAPLITSGATADAIDENSGSDQVVYTADAATADGGAVTWSLADRGDGDDFEIDEASGAVTLEDDPDHEAKSGYTFTVVATDGEGNTSQQAVSLTINDLDEVAPTITSGDSADDVDENSGSNQVIYTVTSSDDGDISTGSTTYSLSPEDDADDFTIDPDTGEVTLIANPDFEVKSSYDFTVVATDAAGNRSEQDVSLEVSDRDDNPPSITSGSTADPIDENSGSGQVVYTATATDNGTVTWSLADGGDAAAFSIDPTSGAVTLNEDPDHETRPSYTFTVVATDDTGNVSDQAVSLGIGDLDEVAPTITSGATAAAIDENSGAGQVVYTVISTDDGDISAGTTTYSLSPVDDAADFAIDADTGEVTLIGDPDFETKPSYDFNVVATDAAGNSSELAVSLPINDIADETAPTLFSSSPTDDATNFSVGDDIVLTFSEDVQAGSGSITISDGSDTRTIDVADSAQVSISGNQVTIDPSADLTGGSEYSVQIDGGAFTDLAGNPYAGISDSTTLNFETGADPSIVVFDLVQGSSSDHSGRAFQSDVSYEIYIVVDSNNSALSTAGDGPGSWGTWSGTSNLGSDDRVVLVGDGPPVQGPISPVDHVSVGTGAIAWQTAINGNAGRLFDVSFARVRGLSADSEALFDTSLPGAFFVNQGGQLSTMYLTTMPAGILTSQGLL